MTMILLIRALPDSATSQAPQVMGVDEFALRRGRSYGTLLVNVQARGPVEILPDLSAESFTAWLAAHPGAEVVCRDRAGCYVDSGRWRLLGQAAGGTSRSGCSAALLLDALREGVLGVGRLPGDGCGAVIRADRLSNLSVPVGRF